MRTSSKRRDYHKYCWKKGELLAAALQSAAVTGFLAVFFYRSFWAAIPLSAAGMLFFRSLGQKKAKRAREELTVQFKECILSVSAALRAGYSLENAFLESRADMLVLYGEGSMICQELEIIRKGLVMNIPLEEQLSDLADRSGSSEIAQFSSVLSIAKKNGGDLPKMIRTSSELIGRRIAVRQEMKTLLSGRQMEQNIMKLMPFVVSFYISVSSPGYFDVLYHNLQGIAVMTLCLAVYLGACAAGELVMKKVLTDGFV